MKRNVFTYHKANQDGLRVGLQKLHDDMRTLQDASAESLWTMFKVSVESLMNTFIPTKVIKDNHKKKPCINNTVFLLYLRSR